MTIVERFRITFWSFILLMSLTSHAQLDTTKIIREEGWIEGMDKYVGLKLSLNDKIETFHLEVEPNDYVIDLYPNTTTLAKLHFNYRFLTFDVKFVPSFLPGNDDDFKKGKTKNFGIATGLNFRHWFHNFSITRTKGFYINNSRDFSTYIPGGPYLQVPDLVVTSIEGSTGYSFNPKFSVKALTTQTERQLKSAGSFIPLLGYRFYSVDNQDPNATSTQRSDNFEFIVSAGYHYTLIVKDDFYFSLGATPGIGYIFTTLNTRFPQSSAGDITTNSNAPVFRFDGRGAVGYNGRSFFAGGELSLSSMSFTQAGTTAVNSDSRAAYQIFAGIRINAPKKLREKVEKVDRLRMEREQKKN